MRKTHKVERITEVRGAIAAIQKSFLFFLACVISQTSDFRKQYKADPKKRKTTKNQKTKKKKTIDRRV